MIKITKRQNEIYQYLVDCAKTADYSPTIEDVCIAMGVKSRGSMHKHIQALIKANLLAPFNGKRRGISLVQSNTSESAQTISVPLLGTIAAGQPLEVMENQEMIDIPLQLHNGGQCYTLVVSGDSMTDIGIFDGDWVIIEKTDRVINGDIVVALIDGDEATLKRFELVEDEVLLHPENKAFNTLIFAHHRVIIQGKLIAHMRKFF